MSAPTIPDCSRSRIPAGGIWIVCSGIVSGLPAAGADVDSVKDLSLRELMDVQVVTSAGRKEQNLGDTAAAVSVITQEDLRRSGVVQFQDALRLVPGVEVARSGNNGWAITARGFNDPFANKLLVMVNGRSIYTPLFSGVFWDSQRLPLEDLERIEVIRGPGASVWGANAVNGVINIITKDARDTVGSLVSLGGGNLDPFVGEVRQGWQLNEHSWLRVYGRFESRAKSELSNGAGYGDDGEIGVGGLRYDWHPTETGHLLLEAEGYGGRIGELEPLPTLTAPYSQIGAGDYGVQGAHVLGRWSSAVADDSEVTLQAYYDYSRRNAFDLLEERHTVDLDAGYRVRWAEHHDLNLGLNYRWSRTHLPPKALTPIFRNSDDAFELASVFAQDDWELVPDRLTVTTGSKFEFNSYTGMEFQPTGRVLRKLAEAHTAWASVSKAVRVPSMAEDNGQIVPAVAPPGTYHPLLPALTRLRGNAAFGAEELLAYELGYRFDASERLTLDAAFYWHDYDQLRGLAPGVPAVESSAGNTYLVVPLDAVNDTWGHSYGAEVGSRWQVAESWQLRLAYTYQEMELQGSLTDAEGLSPRHRVSLHSLLDLPANVRLDTVVRFVDRLSGAGIPAYTTADIQLSWKPRPRLELSVLGRDLFEPRHTEFPTSSFFLVVGQPVVQRSVFARLRWEF